jgi:hypothetical protein
VLPMKRRWPFIVASMLCLPFLVVHLLLLILLAANLTKVPCPALVVFGILYAGHWFQISPMVSWLVLALASISVIRAWFQKGKTQFEIVFTILYSVIMFNSIGLALWLLRSN